MLSYSIVLSFDSCLTPDNIIDIIPLHVYGNNSTFNIRQCTPNVDIPWRSPIEVENGVS